MGMLRLNVMILVVLLLAGCATAYSPIVSKQGSNYEQDVVACNSGVRNTDYSAIFTSGLMGVAASQSASMSDDEKKAFVEKCMKSKGYVVKG